MNAEQRILANLNKFIYKIIGYILLSPALVSVLVFFERFFTKMDYASLSLNYKFKLIFMKGMIYGHNGNVGYLAFYLTLMALVGAYLIKDK